VLPSEVLAALDEPLDEMDEDLESDSGIGTSVPRRVVGTPEVVTSSGHPPSPSEGDEHPEPPPAEPERPPPPEARASRAPSQPPPRSAQGDPKEIETPRPPRDRLPTCPKRRCRRASRARRRCRRRRIPPQPPGRRRFPPFRRAASGLSWRGCPRPLPPNPRPNVIFPSGRSDPRRCHRAGAKPRPPRAVPRPLPRPRRRRSRPRASLPRNCPVSSGSAMRSRPSPSACANAPRGHSSSTPQKVCAASSCATVTS